MKDVYKRKPSTKSDVYSKADVPTIPKIEVINPNTITGLSFPEVQKVEVTNQTEAKDIIFPEVQKVELTNPPVQPEVQKVEVINAQDQKPVVFPDIQRVEVINTPEQKEIVFPNVQKVELINPAKEINIPVGKGNSPKTADPEEYVPVRLTDGKKFYRALEDAYVAASASSDKLVHLTDGNQKTQIVDSGGEQVTVTGGKLDVNASIDTTGLATSANQNPADAYTTNDIDEATTTVTYIGMETSSGSWYVKKIDTTTDTSFGHATITNNASYLTYTTAWAARTLLTYNNFKDAL